MQCSFSFHRVLKNEYYFRSSLDCDLLPVDVELLLMFLVFKIDMYIIKRTGRFVLFCFERLLVVYRWTPESK